MEFQKFYALLLFLQKKAKLRLYVYSLRANGFTLAVNPLEIGSADDTWARQITEGSF